MLKGIEEFCPRCDVSSTENEGKYIRYVWYCDKCAQEHVDNRVPIEDVNEKLKEIERGIDES